MANVGLLSAQRLKRPRMGVGQHGDAGPRMARFQRFSFVHGAGPAAPPTSSHHCLGRASHELTFSHDGGRAWGRSEQRPMQEACERAHITPRIGFHGLRHTWASLAVMNGVPLLVVAKNRAIATLAWSSITTDMWSFIVDAIHAGAPVYGVSTESSVVSLAGRGDA